MRGRLFPTDADWCEWHQDPPLPAGVLVRVGRAASGRLILTGLRVDGTPTAELLRSIPVGRIEAAANAQLTIVDDVAVAVAAVRAPGRAPQVSESGWETADPGLAVRRPGGPRVGTPPAAALPSAEIVAGQRGRSDEFYRDIARAYADRAQASTRPAAELAEVGGVPASTAHRWIKEARRRGFLPPGRPGKSG